MNDTDQSAAIEERYCPSCDRSFVVPLKHCPNDGTKLVTIASDPLIGRILEDRFRIDEKIGAGGMGTVYRGAQTSIGRSIAIKVIHSRLSQRTEVVKRFLREAKLASRLNQPNTVTVLDFGQSDDGLLYLIMELLEGRTLGQMLRDEAPLSVGRAAGVAMQLCDALTSAHGLSIVHRDLKPSNVVILDEPAGRDYVKVLDFGLAKSLSEDSATTITHSDAILGTPAYISPEAVLGRDLDARADLYALGVMLYEMVTGRLPFDATTANLMLTSHVNELPRPLPEELDPRLRALIERMLSKAPDERPGSAAEVRAALEPLRALTATISPSGSREAIAVADTVSPDDLERTTLKAPPAETPRRRAPVAVIGALIAAAAVVVSLVVIAGRNNNAAAPAAADAAPTSTATSIADAGAPAPQPDDAAPVATADAAPTLEVDAAPRRRADRRRDRRRNNQETNTDGNDSDKPPPPLFLKSGGDGGVP